MGLVEWRGREKEVGEEINEVSGQSEVWFHLDLELGRVAVKHNSGHWKVKDKETRVLMVKVNHKEAKAV